MTTVRETFYCHIQTSPCKLYEKCYFHFDQAQCSNLVVSSISSLSDTNLLDCSCNGVIALALDSSVYLWNSETRTLVGHLDPSPQLGKQSISSLCWSRDGRVLCIGTRRGELQVNTFQVEVKVEHVDGRN